MWVLENADYMQLMPVKEKRKRARELAAEAEEECEDEETPTGTPGTAGNEHVQDQWKDIKKYTFDMRDLGQLMRINLKLSVKHTTNTSPPPNKCKPSEWNALPWEGLEKHSHSQDLPIDPCVSSMWRALFSRETKPHFRNSWLQ
jgi:hypothetical protein